MIYRLSIAGHCFELELSKELITQKWLTQYQPFFVQTADKPLFTCRITAEAFVLPTHLQTIYKEVSAEHYSLFEVYADSKGHYIIKNAVTKKDAHLFYIHTTKDYRHTTIYLNAPKQPDEQFMHKVNFTCENAVRFLYAQNTATLKTICVHASAVSYRGKAYLFMGHSGAGKSTHSQLWLKHQKGTELVNDDNPIIRIDENGLAKVYGSPWSGKTPCYKNITLPIGGMVHIVQAAENRIKAYSPINGYRFVRASTSGFSYIDPTIADGLYYTTERIISQITIFQLACKPDQKATELCKRTITT